jgi:hypothetical protein
VPEPSSRAQWERGAAANTEDEKKKNTLIKKRRMIERTVNVPCRNKKPDIRVVLSLSNPLIKVPPS